MKRVILSSSSFSLTKYQQSRGLTKCGRCTRRNRLTQKEEEEIEEF